MKVNIWKGTILALAGLLAAGAAVAANIEWDTLNPAFRGAMYVNDASVCVGCHEDALTHYGQTGHAQVAKFGKQGSRTPDCEACHGPRSAHVADPDSSLALPALSQAAVCLQCHQGENRIYWKSGRHQAAGLSCASCHTVMEPKSKKSLLSRASESELCYSCHANVRSEMNKSSHHPVREGKLECSSCHQVHGTSNPALLIGATVNETCYSCHQEKRGPFIWEHAPVREDCMTCHEAHGSNNRKLQNSKDSFLCLQCHTYGGHINLPRYNRTSNPYGEGCVNCHVTVHGSNSPSGAKLTR
ncbi:MAG: DmsE family decaheme c-type cytochrome [Desulfuromonadales bacterium]|nr:DmsE family decaheme c-type cytochrome [Desulfuromonadales bacterium]